MYPCSVHLVYYMFVRTLPEGPSRSVVGVLDENMTEARDVQKSLTLPDGTNVAVVITFEARRMF